MKSINKHFTASGIVIKDDKVLLVWHNKLNTWLYPGGHIEENETPDEAVIREIKEETNLDVKLVDDMKVNIKTEIAKTLHMPYIILEEMIGNRDDNHYHIDMVYLCTSATSQVQIKENEVKKYGWFSKKEIENMELLDNLKILLLSVLKKEHKCMLK